MTILQVLNLSKDYDHRTIWSDVSFQLGAGEKVALIGTNGCGKSTLLRILAGGDQATKGLIQPIKPDLGIGYLGQDWEQRTLGTPLNSVMSGESRLGALKNKLHEAESSLGPNPSSDLMDRYLQLLTEYQNVEGYEHEQRAHTLLRKMGLTDAEIELPMALLSGGQRTRVGLARALFGQPDLLLLDEPTTHLDVDALEWLEETLRRYDGTVLVVSHDRYFIDAVTTRTLELDNGDLESFDGSYSDYVQQKQHRFQSQTAAYQKQQSEIKQIEAAMQRQKQWFLKASAGPMGENQDGFFIGKYRDRATKQSAGFKAKETRLQHINEQRVDRPWEARKLNMRLHERQSNARWLVRARELTMAFPEKSLFRSANLMLERDSRVAILGPNGCGKTTLLRVLMGELEPTGGTVERAGFTVGYFGQEADTLDPNLTILAEIQSTGMADQTDARTLAGAFLFRGEDVYKKVALLSSGEKARLALAKLVAKHPDLLVLDEPTNHLDIPSREQVESVLAGYKGTMILVSHDRYLLRKLATCIWAFKDGSVIPYPGSYDEYLMESGRRVLAAGHPESESLLNQLAICETRLALVSGKLAACPKDDVEQMGELTQEFMSIGEEIEGIKASLSGMAKAGKNA